MLVWRRTRDGACSGHREGKNFLGCLNVFQNDDDVYDGFDSLLKRDTRFGPKSKSVSASYTILHEWVNIPRRTCRSRSPCRLDVGQDAI